MSVLTPALVASILAVTIVSGCTGGDSKTIVSADTGELADAIPRRLLEERSFVVSDGLPPVDAEGFAQLFEHPDGSVVLIALAVWNSADAAQHGFDSIADALGQNTIEIERDLQPGRATLGLACDPAAPLSDATSACAFTRSTPAGRADAAQSFRSTTALAFSSEGESLDTYVDIARHANAVVHVRVAASGDDLHELRTRIIEEVIRRLS